MTGTTFVVAWLGRGSRLWPPLAMTLGLASMETAAGNGSFGPGDIAFTAKYRYSEASAIPACAALAHNGDGSGGMIGLKGRMANLVDDLFVPIYSRCARGRRCAARVSQIGR